MGSIIRKLKVATGSRKAIGLEEKPWNSYLIALARFKIGGRGLK